MLTEITSEVIPSELAQIVTSVFNTMLGLEVLHCETLQREDHDPLPEPVFERCLTSAVRLTGEWEAVVLFQCDHPQARCFAEQYLGMGSPSKDDPVTASAMDCAQDSTVDAVIPDVLGELANMIGGNLKCALNKGLHLSVPQVVDDDYKSRFPGFAVRQWLVFHCLAGFFSVAVMLPTGLVSFTGSTN